VGPIARITDDKFDPLVDLPRGGVDDLAVGDPGGDGRVTQQRSAGDRATVAGGDVNGPDRVVGVIAGTEGPIKDRRTVG
jgi:hypothetical protein